MLFPTSIFALFFAIVFAIHWLTVSRPRIRKAALLLGSLFFYGWWSWKFALMLLASSLLNHAVAVWMDRLTDSRARRRAVTLGVAANLLVLGVFKYAGFLVFHVFVPLAVPVCARLGTTAQLIHLQEVVLPFIDRIVLPVGISFYTFQALSYVVDVYRRKIRPARHVIDFANYLAFFPQLVAGPIVRAADLLPQMEAMPGLETRINTSRAGLFILTGLFKKIVVANWLAEHLADPVFGSPENYAAADLVLGVYAYAVQIYCDFSAYSDIAVGCALLLGFTFPFNFNAPYFAGTLQDFWRRWHISLSTWLRDYLYIPLGGSRCGPARCSANLILTFFLGGLWHGAAWTFVVWGLFHGVYLTLERPFLKRLQSLNRFWRLVAKVWLFQMVCLSWVLFRSSSWTGVTEMLRGLGRGGASELFGPQAALALLCGFAMQFLDADRAVGLERRIDALPPWVQGLTAAAILVIILGVGPQGVAPFIYFQF